MTATELLLPTRDLSVLVGQVISSQLHEGENIPFADEGVYANNHLDLGYDETPPGLRLPIVRQLRVLIARVMPYPHFIATVPSGADGWGELLLAEFNPELRQHKIELLKFNKKEGKRREFELAEKTEEKIRHIKENGHKPAGIVLDDATTDGGTTESMADYVQKFGLEAALVISIFHRGKREELHSKYRRAAVFSKYIPVHMDWEIYRNDGILQELQ